MSMYMAAMSASMPVCAAVAVAVVVVVVMVGTVVVGTVVVGTVGCFDGAGSDNVVHDEPSPLEPPPW